VTLQDLRERTGSDYERIGQAISMRMAGMGAGAILGELTRISSIDITLQYFSCYHITSEIVNLNSVY